MQVILVPDPQLIKRVFRYRVVLAKGVAETRKTLHPMIPGTICGIPFQEQAIVKFQIGAASNTHPETFNGVDIKERIHRPNVDPGNRPIAIDAQFYRIHKTTKRSETIQAINHLVHTDFVFIQTVMPADRPVFFSQFHGLGIADSFTAWLE